MLDAPDGSELKLEIDGFTGQLGLQLGRWAESESRLDAVIAAAAASRLINMSRAWRSSARAWASSSATGATRRYRRSSAWSTSIAIWKARRVHAKSPPQLRHVLRAPRGVRPRDRRAAACRRRPRQAASGGAATMNRRWVSWGQRSLTARKHTRRARLHSARVQSGHRRGDQRRRLVVGRESGESQHRSRSMGRSGAIQRGSQAAGDVEPRGARIHYTLEHSASIAAGRGQIRRRRPAVP